MVESKIRLSNRSQVTLREITADTVRTICYLSVQDEQEKFVAPNAISMSQFKLLVSITCGQVLCLSFSIAED